MSRSAVHIGPPFFALKTRRTQFNSSLIESWGSKTEQTQAQNGSEPNQNCLIFTSVELVNKRGGQGQLAYSGVDFLTCYRVTLADLRKKLLKIFRL